MFRFPRHLLVRLRGSVFSPGSRQIPFHTSGLIQSSIKAQPEVPLSHKKQIIPPNLSFDPQSSFVSSITELTRKKASKLEEDLEGDVSELSNHSVSGAAASADAEVDESEDDEYEDDDGEGDFILPTPVYYAVPLPDRLNVSVHTLFPPLAAKEGEEPNTQVGTLWLDETVFGCDPIRVDLLKRAVDYFRAKKRGRRKAKTKTIGEVSGSGKKRRPQKKTGRARMGHSRPPHHRGGAKAHGPKNVTDYGNIKLNKKVRRLALKHALSQKLKEGNLIIMNQFYDLPTHKTSELVRLLKPWNIASKVDKRGTFILDHYHPNGDYTESEPNATSFRGVPLNLFLATSNLWNVTVGDDHAINVYDVLKNEKLVLTLAALEQLQTRLSEDA